MGLKFRTIYFIMFLANEEFCVIIKQVKGNSSRVHILRDSDYLTAHVRQNKVFWSDTNATDRDTTNEWILEEQGSHMFIRLAKDRYNKTQYLGAPNRYKRGFLYTQKNRWTRWALEPTDFQDTFKLSYAGETFNTNELTLVVARYEEDVQWTEAYSDICTLYNKGESKPNTSLPFVIKLENIGREGHTYLYHIVSNYESLSQSVVFTQADPFPHNPTILCAIDAIEQTRSIQPLGYIYSDTIPSKEVVKAAARETDYGLKYMVTKINRNLQIVDPVPFDDKGINEFIEDHKYIYPRQAHMSLVNAFLQRCKVPYESTSEFDSLIPFSFAGLLKVNREVIRVNSKDLYKNMLRELTFIHPQGGLNGYILERVWLYIFGYRG
jgi:hypothetical protein